MGRLLPHSASRGTPARRSRWCNYLGDALIIAFYLGILDFFRALSHEYPDAVVLGTFREYLLGAVAQGENPSPNTGAFGGGGTP